MNVKTRLRLIEKAIENKQLDSHVCFWNSVEEFEKAKKDGKIIKNAVHIIDDVPENVD